MKSAPVAASKATMEELEQEDADEVTLLETPYDSAAEGLLDDLQAELFLPFFSDHDLRKKSAI